MNNYNLTSSMDLHARHQLATLLFYVSRRAISFFPLVLRPLHLLLLKFELLQPVTLHVRSEHCY